MSFDDIVGLLVFLGIIAVSAVFQKLKEKGEDKDTKKQSSPSNKQPANRKILQGPETNIPKRKIVVIRKETEPTPLAPPFLSSYQQRQKDKEPLPEGKSVVTKNEKQIIEKSWEGPPPEKKGTFHVPKSKKTVETEVEAKFNKETEGVSSLVKKSKVEISAPMKRASYLPSRCQPQISLKGNIGNIPQLQWAVIMMEVLSPPKALRDE
ncbi:MAG TPA: hypothetical protein PLX23_12415 [Candidatus Hydrogenedens sp.]|nr:hypothetical protein [Candidatus Hydrogenedens sp.]